MQPSAQPKTTPTQRFLYAAVGLVGVAALLTVVLLRDRGTESPPAPGPTGPKPGLRYEPYDPMDFSGYTFFMKALEPWRGDAPFEEIANSWRNGADRALKQIDDDLASGRLAPDERVVARLHKASLINFTGRPAVAYEELTQLRAEVEPKDGLAEQFLFTIIFGQGVTCLRRGEDENCIMCRGESSCIFPISPAAVHVNPGGSRAALVHFREYLAQFPSDLGVRWLLNVAHMTLGEYPAGVDPAYALKLEPFMKSEFDIGKFREVGHAAGLHRLNMQGGGVMEDFDGDGLLDIVVTANDPTQPMIYYRNTGDGTFEDRTGPAGLGKLTGGLYCVQGDFNNDGRMDLFIPRGAWQRFPVRPSLLRNNGDGTFTDVAREAGVGEPLNSISAAWTDYDNDGHLDLFVCAEWQPSRLYRNTGDGTFADATAAAGLPLDMRFCKGVSWIDYDNDGRPDLFLNFFPDQVTRTNRTARLFHNEGDGTFTDVTKRMGIDVPYMGFSCMAFDYDNDGYLDLFATAYDFSLDDILRGLVGEPAVQRQTSRLYRNRQGKGFDDVTKEAGLDRVYATMGSNYADFDNDGYLDIYLGTGSPSLAMLVPNRMFRNVAGRRFADITASSGTGHLQKGHSVACGDLRRTGNIDIFHQMGGVTQGDRYHNVLFQNPGQGNNWLTVKLVGQKTNRAAIGARIKVVAAGKEPLTAHRHVSSGSSFGANPLQQTIGLAKNDRIELLEVTWPTSGTTQVFRDVKVNQAIEITEFADGYRPLDWKPVPIGK